MSHACTYIRIRMYLYIIKVNCMTGRALTPLKFLYGTNCTISLAAVKPWNDNLDKEEL